jgi:hypothetical protein
MLIGKRPHQDRLAIGVGRQTAKGAADILHDA